MIMNVRNVLAAGALIVASICAPKAHGSTITTLTYAGPDFSFIDGTTYEPFFDVSGVSGTLSFAGTLGDNLSDAPITPSSFSFSDQAQTFTNAGTYTTETFDFTTSATGQITAWYIHIAEGSGIPDIFTTYQLYSPGNTVDYGRENAGSYGEYSGPAIGSWTETTQESSTPEPSPVVLVSTALMALAFVARKRVARRVRQSTLT
jgi:hypothetical protein